MGVKLLAFLNSLTFCFIIKAKEPSLHIYWWIYKSFKFISQIFVVKEREMEIGYPTDVKHVAHIGLDAASGSAPSWMNDFKTTSEFSTSLGSLAEFRDSSSMALSTWSSHDFDQSMGHQQACDMFKDVPPTDLPNIPKKQKRKKSRKMGIRWWQQM
ncbi:hypothetical protein CMV_009998 [Castanea mollissima]|uniref:CRIB domain-containing protein n=1 Tax=Castanea mollissima TaxID=60419 RepID=A0A8J4R8U6_9ROSI|nr:hypothetical protein CMV_009998 [Castanea mollissima]